MVVKLEGRYKGNDFVISKDGLSALIFTRSGILRKDYQDLMKYPLMERIQKIKTKIYYEINKLK
jgi:hypothetical protein